MQLVQRSLLSKALLHTQSRVDSSALYAMMPKVCPWPGTLKEMEKSAGPSQSEGNLSVTAFSSSLDLTTTARVDCA